MDAVNASPQRHTAASTSSFAEAVDETREPVPCRFCARPLRYLCFKVGDRRFFPHLEECTCDGAREERERRRREEEERQRRFETEQRMERIERLFRQSKLGLRFKERTFENFVVKPYNRKAYEIALDYARNFEEYRKKGLGLIFYSSTPGTGKTHLAAAVSHYLINNLVTVIFGNITTLLGKLRHAYDEESRYTEMEMIDELTGADLLVLDDLGKEKPSQWVEEKLYAIINERYENYKPIIITTNLSLEEIENKFENCGRAIVSRLVEMCRGVRIEGPDFRKEKLK